MTDLSRLSRILLGFGVSAVIAAILFPIFGRSHKSDWPPPCTSNLKQLGLGLMQYAQDYDNNLPLITASNGWADAVFPYVKAHQLFQCPQETNGPAPQEDLNLTGYTDFFYNSQLEGHDQTSLKKPERIVMLAEGNDGQESTDATYSKPGIPPAWRTDPTSPAFRHQESANYLFADGHVKTYDIESISNEWSITKFYFQPSKP